MSSNIDTPPITPQQYEILLGGGPDTKKITQQRLSRRRFLRRSMLAVWGLSTTAAVAGALYFMYPRLAGQFGSAQTVGKKSEFAAATPEAFKVNDAGVFHRPVARTYVVHMSKDTKFAQSGETLNDLLSSEWVVKDSDGSFWIGLYQRCVHLGCTVPFRNDCVSFKCPCHGSHYHVTGEYLDG